MASHSLAIAKASLAAGMIRPDPTSISKAEIAHFHSLLEAVLKRCSSANIQLCKGWLLKNIIPSAARTIAIGKYLVALSLSFAKIADQDDHKAAKDAAPPGRRRQLHILYLLSDLLHHTQFHFESPSASAILTENIQAYLVDLFGAASAYTLEVYVKQHECITELLDIWEAKGQFQPSFIRKLRYTATIASKADHGNKGEDTKLSEESLSEEKKDAPYILPSSHGDPLTQFYDLPAGNMVPHIMPNSARAINPQFVKALRFTAGPADEKLVVALKDFMKNVDSVDVHGFEDREGDMDVDELGQSILGDELAGNILEGEAYYGWSKSFCKKMKSRGVRLSDDGEFLGRAGSVDRSSSSCRSRRCSYSSSSRSQDRPLDKSPSSSSSSDHGPNRRMGQRSSSRPKNSSTQKRPYRSRSRSRSPSYSPPQTAQNLQRTPPPANTQPVQQVQAQPLSLPSSMHFSHPFSKGFPLGPGGVPIPPPPPPHYRGPWPPPPPPMPISNGGNAMPALVSLTGPKIGQTHGAPVIGGVVPSGFQSQTPQYLGGWTQQQSGHVSAYPHGDHGGAQRSFDRNIYNDQGRAYGRGGWTR